MKKHNENQMVAVDVFFKTIKRQKPDNIYTLRIEVPLSEVGDDEIANCEMLIGKSPIGMGTHQTGVFEFQTDMGIYQRIDKQQIRLHRPDWSVSPRLVQFRTWKQLDEEWKAEEVAAA